MHSDNVIIGQTCTALCKRRLSILCKQSLSANSSHVFCWIVAKLPPFGPCTVEYPSRSNCTEEHAMKLFITTIFHFGFTDSIQASMINILHFEPAENRVYIYIHIFIFNSYFLLITCPLLHIIQRSEEYLVSRTSPYSPRAYYCTVAEKSSFLLPAHIYILVINVTTACSAANVGLLTTKEKREEKKGQLTEKEPSGWGYREL